MLALPCCRCCDSDGADGDGGGAEGASADGSDGSPPVSMDTVWEAARNMAGTVLGAVVGVCLRPRGGGGGSPSQQGGHLGPQR